MHLGEVVFSALEMIKKKISTDCEKGWIYSNFCGILPRFNFLSLLPHPQLQILGIEPRARAGHGSAPALSYVS